MTIKCMIAASLSESAQIRIFVVMTNKTSEAVSTSSYELVQDESACVKFD